MIVFDLACASGGHVFEAWFGSTEDYEAQRARGLVSCPICGGADVEKAVMAPRVGAKGNQRDLPLPAASNVAAPATKGASEMGQIKALMHALAKAQTQALENSDYVGPRFAEEARAMHLGEADQRAIHGQATPEQARALLDEGIEVAPLPFPIRPPGTDN